MTYIKLIPYIAILLLIAAVVYQTQHVAILQAQAITLQTQLTASQGSVKQLMSSVDEQNTAIDKLKADSANRLSATSALIATANKARNQANLTANQLLKAQAPVGIDKCQAAINLINKEIN